METDSLMYFTFGGFDRKKKTCFYKRFIDLFSSRDTTFTGITVISLCFIAEAFTQALLHTKHEENIMLSANLIILQELCMYTLNPCMHYT